MPKRALKIPAAREGRRARWMLEVSAHVGRRVRRAAAGSTRSARSRRAKKSAKVEHTLEASRHDTMKADPVAAPSSESARSRVQEMVVVGSVAALVVALVAFARYPVPRTEATGEDPAYVSKAVADVSKAILDKQPPAPRVSTKSAFAAAAPALPRTVRREADNEPSTSVKPSAVQASLSAAPAPAVSDGRKELVAITGCLEMSVDEEQFRLTETEGAAAPKGRSWRSGFLKKGSTAVDLVEISDRLALRQHVGQRVVASGVLSGRDLQLRSFRAAGAACD